MFLLEINKQVHYLGANGHVQGRDRLIEDDDLRVEGKRPGNADSLSLAAAELVWEERGLVRAESDLDEEVADPISDLLPGHIGIYFERLAYNAADTHPGIEGCPWVLEHRLNRPLQLSLAGAA